MAIIIKKKGQQGPPPDPVVTRNTDAPAAGSLKYVDVDGSNYENLIRALARRAAREDHKAEFG
jgi:hypothetical protein